MTEKWLTRAPDWLTGQRAGTDPDSSKNIHLLHACIHQSVSGGEGMHRAALLSLGLGSNLHRGHRGAAAPLCAMEPVFLAVRLHASLQSDSAFSAMSRGSAPTLIPLIGGCPPREPG